MQQAKAHTETVEDTGEGLLMRSKLDDLSVWQSVRRFKRVGCIAMLAAFSASLDGYQINLNGGIVSNAGFIRQFSTSGTTIIAGKYISAWGGIQSAGQTIGQVLLQYATERLGRKAAMMIIWVVLTASVFAESFATHWQHWLVAKLFSGMGVGMLQSTMPLYLSEISPTQLRGFFINAYSFWFVLGQLFASVALNRLKANDPLDFRTPIYTQSGRIIQLTRVEIMTSTLAVERQQAEQNSELGPWAVFKGRNLIRFIISGWPKITQQFVGLAVFNTYATYFFQYAGNKDPFLVTLILSSVQLISMIATATLTDSIGRRPLTVYPYAVTVVSVLCLGIIGCFDYTAKATSSLLIFFACLATFSTTGASAIGYAYAAEIPQQRLRAQTAGWSLAVSNCIAIIFSFCTPLMINGSVKWGVKTGFFFAGTGTVAVAIAWFILPEVARRTPAEIDEMFEKKINLRKFDKYVTEVQVHAHELQDRKKVVDEV
ncbi:General alpha-glucoside permease [Fusarium odoratissimum]|uniref:General alpha-glucoside permease n=1 Tax=Fusarium oxysporum f. sp. cubense (strain race 4) TaxID=2502994 RepID=N1S2K9_FUSC4|nr:General alpha-glucoside permease [Fusarium odoratissimum]